MSVITNKWNDGSGDSINIESPSFQGNPTVKISSPVQKVLLREVYSLLESVKKIPVNKLFLLLNKKHLFIHMI